MNNIEHLESERNYNDFRVAFLHSKFGTHNGILVPNRKVILNEDFINTDSLLRIPEQTLHFKIFWINKGIAGEVCVPGQGNYAYIDGKFYHLVKMHSNGFIKGMKEEWFYYDLIYDDGQNEWMKNTFYLKGTLELTGDQELVKKNIHQMEPIIQNVNGFRFLNGIEKSNVDEPETELKLPADIPLEMVLPGLSSVNKNHIDTQLLEFHQRGKLEPVEEKLVIPFLYRTQASGNGKGNILKSINRIVNEGIRVFDVTVTSAVDQGQAQKFRNILEVIMGSNELYLASNNDNRVYSFAKAINPTKWISEIDLSQCTDITVLDRLTLLPLYTVSNPRKQFTVRGFVDKICNKHGWPSDYKDDMINTFESIVVPMFANIINYDEVIDNKVFRNVTLEKIERDIIDIEDPRGEYKNPEWKAGSDTKIISDHDHKNHIGDNTKPLGDSGNIYIVQGFTNKGVEASEEEKNKIPELYRNLINKGSTEDVEWFKITEESISAINALVYMPDEYKMVSEDDKTDFLDFTKNTNDHFKGFGLIPDYSRKTHVLATNNWINTDDYYLTMDTKNSIYSGRIYPSGTPLQITPFILNEIVQENEQDIILDGKKPGNDFFKAWKFLGKDTPHPKDQYGKYKFEDRSKNTFFRYRGAEILSRGFLFMALNDNINNSNSRAFTKHHQYYSQCGSANYCIHGESGVDYPNNYKYNFRTSWAQRPECVYTNDNREWRRFHTEMTLPVKTDTFNTIEILREFDDIPDNFLRGEVINSGIKKGKIKAYIRGLKESSNNQPGAYLYTKEEEEKIPKNTVVSIYICLRQSGSPEGDTEYDKKAADDYKKTHNKDWNHRMDNLLTKLCRCFFLLKWENGGEAGAIPDWIKNMSSLSPNTYPKNGDGRSQLALSGFKPYHGRWYMAGTRFLAPAIYDYNGNNALRLLDGRGTLLDMKGSNDGFMAEIPNDETNYNQYFSKGAYRDPVSSIKRNTLLAFYYGHFMPDTQYADIYFEKGNFPDDTNNFVKIDDYSNINLIQLYDVIGTSNKDYNYWKRSFTINKEGTHYLMDWDTLLLSDFVKNVRTYKTVRTDNPKKMPMRWKHTVDVVGDKSEFIPFDNEVPPFFVPYLDPDDKECVLHGWEKNDTITHKIERMALYKEKLNELARNVLLSLESWNTWIKFEGTNWYASIKVNNKGNIPKWDYELFTNEITNFKTKSEKKGNFINHKESDVDVIINTRNEISIYGNKFPLKSRKITDEVELDIGLHVKPLDDIKQTEAAAWYSINMNLNNQDIIATFIETPKELTKYQGFSAYEREKLIREIGLRGEEFIYNKQMLEYQREENKFTNQYEKDGIYKEWKYDVARGATQIIGGALDMVTGGVGSAVATAGINVAQSMTGTVYGSRDVFPDYDTTMRFQNRFDRYKNAFQRPRTEHVNISGSPAYPWASYQAGSPDGRVNSRMAHYGLTQARSAAGGAMGIVGGALTIAEAYETFNIKDEYRKQKYAMAEKKLSAEGDILNKRHEFERKNLLSDLWAMSANVIYPQLNANLVYKLYNKNLNLRDVHMIQYYPKGKLLEYIKEYYREFGYNIMVRNFECTGIQNIKNHLRYQGIYELNHPNINIQEMIRARALAGVKVIPWIQ